MPMKALIDCALLLPVLGGCGEQAGSAPATRVAPPRSCPSAAEEAYFEEISGLWAVVTHLMLSHGEELEGAANTPALIWNTDWLAAREADVEIIAAKLDEIYNVEAPESAAHIDLQVEEIVLDMEGAVRKMNTGLQDLDVKLMELGAEELLEAVPKMRRAGDAMETFCW